MTSFATKDGKIIVLAGKSRSGKSAYAAKEVKSEQRIIAWDPEEQWCNLSGWKRVDNQRDFSAALVKAGRGKLRIAYVHTAGDMKEDFNLWSQKVFKFLDLTGPLAVIPEELADVSTPGKAPEWWGQLIRKGLKRGLTVYPISQRWAEADKTAFNNISEIVCFSMMPMDVDYMAKRTGLDPEELKALKKIETATTITCPYIRLHADSGEIERGALKFRKK